MAKKKRPASRPIEDDAKRAKNEAPDQQMVAIEASADEESCVLGSQLLGILFLF
jgi:hypothetical protein